MFHKLSKSHIFKGIPENEIPILLNQGNYTVKRYKKDEVIASRGEECNHLLVLIDGSVRAEMLDFSGKTLKVEDILAPRAIANGFLFGDNSIFPVNIQANEGVQILFIPRNSVLEHLKSNEIFLGNFLDTISNYIYFLTQRLYFLSFTTIREKIAQYLLNISHPDKEYVVMPRSQTELSEYFGVARPSLSRVLKNLEQDGIIMFKRNKIRILNRGKLEKILK